MKSQVDLLKGSILPTLTKLALPIMATSFIQMAYNMVDMIWIGRIGSDSVAAVGTAGMYIWLSAGIVSVAKIGGQVKVGHALGANNEKEATEYTKSALQLGIILGIVFGIVCLLFSRQLIGFFNLNSEVVSTQAESYLRVTGGGILFSFIALIISGILMAMGDSTTTFKINSIGLIINMVLDPLFIFGFGPIPELGATGAAIATLGAQIIVCTLLVVEVRRNKSIFQNINLCTKIDWKPIKNNAKNLHSSSSAEYIIHLYFHGYFKISCSMGGYRYCSTKSWFSN
jgi:putative MATE family efflux protein